MILLICQLIAGMIGLIRDLTLPYSASRETAHYIQKNNLDKLFILGSEDFTMTPISGYLGQKIYYPESQTLGSFVLFNNKRTIVNYSEILQQTKTQLENLKDKPILLVVNHKLTASLPDLKIKPIQELTHSFIVNEQYYLYLVSLL